VAEGGDGEDKMKRVLLVEDHRSFRQSLARLLDKEPDIEVVAQAGSLAEGRALAAVDGVNAAVVGLLLPDGDGIELVGELRGSDPGISVLVLTVIQNREVHDRAIDMGADEVLTKEAILSEIIGAVRHLGEHT
jgi:DNA-binding NarL/FixJ family response regulator